MPKGIPLYTSDGEICDWISEQRLTRLDRLGLIRVVRHKKGHIARCILHRRPGEPKPMRPADYLGTRYSYREHLESGNIVWSMKQLGRGEELRSFFMSAVSDCLANP